MKNLIKIILTTLDKNNALEAFEYKSVVDYLVKQISKERFNTSIEKLETLPIKVADNSLETQKLEDYIYTKVDKSLVKIDIPSIYLVGTKED